MQEDQTLEGRRFGRWLAEGETVREGGRRKRLCRCDCGTERYVDEGNLLSGKSKSCGCLSRERSRAAAPDLTGMRFGLLTVLGRGPSRQARICWNCRCDCGNTAVVAGRLLREGKTRSCGCLRSVRVAENRNIRDLHGMQFGDLQVLEAAEGRDKRGSACWRCRCLNCGREAVFTENQLVSGGYKSCGCRKRENAAHLGRYLHFVDDTCVEWLEKRKHRRDNTSGFRGVYLLKSGRWRANIGFRKQQYYLGMFDTMEEAVAARLAAEHLLHDAFVKAFQDWEAASAGRADWAGEHPFQFADPPLEELRKHIEAARPRQIKAGRPGQQAAGARSPA